MIFKGDLSKYHPADAMAFLSQVGSDGVLSVADENCLITLTFKAGRLLDAQSALGDQKLLRCLQHQGLINDSQIRRIQQIQRETGLSVREILAKLAYLPLVEIKAHITMSIFEVLRQLFLLDRGDFNFTETPVEDDGAGIQMDISHAALTVLPQADEYRDFIKTIQTAERRVRVNDSLTAPQNTSSSARMIFKFARQQPTVHELISKTPLPSHEVLQHIQQFLVQEVITLLAPNPQNLAPAARPALDPLFSAYKQALKTLLSNYEVLPRLGAMISFGRLYYDHMLILTVKQGQLIHCKTISMAPNTGIVQKSTKGNLGRIIDDPVFAAVGRSGVAFFGAAFPCNLLDQFIDQIPDDECALIPILTGSAISIFLYVHTSKHFSGVSPHHYLELLSWIVGSNPQRSTPAVATQADNDLRQGLSLAKDAAVRHDTQPQIVKMVSRIKDLPPLPTLVSKALQMLSDPETPLDDIEGVIEQDQALVAKLIKVGNSALYGGLQKVTTLRQVLARLGLKTTRNLVLTASTRSYFMSNRKGLRLWGEFLWQHSVESGLAARRIAQTLHYPDPEEAFIGGLVHDIGKLIILMLFPEQYKEILKQKKIRQISSKPAEIQTIGSDHEQIGRLLMDRWNMPDSAKACAEFHHRFPQAGNYANLTAIVACADYLSRQYGSNPDPLLADDHAYGRKATEALEITDTLKTALTEDVINDFQNAEMLIM